MPRRRSPYQAEFRSQMANLVRSGRTSISPPPSSHHHESQQALVQPHRQRQLDVLIAALVAIDKILQEKRNVA